MMRQINVMFMIVTFFLPILLSLRFTSTYRVVRRLPELFSVPSIFDVHSHDAKESELEITLPSTTYLESHKASSVKDERRCHFEEESECANKMSGICPVDGRACSADRGFLTNKRKRNTNSGRVHQPNNEGTINLNNNNNKKNKKEMEFNDELLRKQINQQKKRISDLQKAQELKHNTAADGMEEMITTLVTPPSSGMANLSSLFDTFTSTSTLSLSSTNQSNLNALSREFGDKIVILGIVCVSIYFLTL